MRHEPRYLFGPVASRRLGRSLGVDLTPFKTCSFDCVYCEVGRTTHRTSRRQVYTPVRDVLAELEATLATIPPPDYVTLAGSGEPTLHAQLDELIRGIRRVTTVPIAVLTNGSLLSDPPVRQACGRADLVLPTLAAHDEPGFQRIHRPAPGLTLEQHLAGLVTFRQEQPAAMWLELFILEGFNAGDDDLRAFKPLIERIDPHRIQINTAVRPPAEPDARPVSAEKLAAWAAALGPRAEVIADVHRVCQAGGASGDAEILAICQRRPCTLTQIAAGLGLSVEDTAARIARLRAAGKLRVELLEGQEFLVAGR